MDGAMAGLEALYHETAPALLGYLRRICRRREAAEDGLQETFLLAARRLDRLAAAVSPRAWLYAIARRVAATQLRRRRVVASLIDEPVATGDTPPADVESVRRAIAALPDPLRETLELRLREELSYAEIAEVLAIPVGTVRSRLHHALRRVRALLDAEKLV